MKHIKALLLASAIVFSPVLALATVQKWTAGNYSSWTSVCTTELNSLPASDAVLCSTAVQNQTNNDLYAHFSVTFGSVTTFAGAPYVQLYLYPLNQDGSTYGDGSFGSAAGGPPPAQYATQCVIPAPVSTTSAFKGECWNVPIPPLAFKVVLYNNLSNTGNAASSGNVVYIQTSNFAIN